MQNLKKMILVTAVMMFAVLVTSCGDEKKQEIQFVDRPQNQSSFFQQGYQSGYQQNFGAPNLYGYEGRDCSTFNNSQGYNSFNNQGYNNYQGNTNLPITGSNDFPTAGHLLQGNPEAAMRYNNLCYRVGDVRSMYEQYYRGQGYNDVPWNLYASSPYANFQLINGGSQYGGSSSGSYNMNHSESYNWHNSGGAYNSGYNPYDRRGGDQFYLEFEYDGRDRGTRYDDRNRDPFDHYMSDDFWDTSDWGY